MTKTSQITKIKQLPDNYKDMTYTMKQYQKGKSFVQR